MHVDQFRHWLRHEDLAHVLKKSDAELNDFCREKNIAPTRHRRGSNKRILFSDEQVRYVLKSAGFLYPKQAQIISCLMCKGGVGKTTTAYFLASRLVSYGARVLVIDSDPQSNLTAVLRPEQYGFSVKESTPVLVDVLTQQCPLEDAILPLTQSLHLLPSTALNSMLEKELVRSTTFSIGQLGRILDTVSNRYDYILFDCAPSLSLVNTSIVRASQLVLLPVQLDEFSRSGLNLTLSEIEDLQNTFEFTTMIRILVNRFNPVEKLSMLYLGRLAERYKSILLQSTIRQSSEIKMAFATHRDFFIKSQSRAKEDFDHLAREILNLTTTQQGMRHAHH